MIEWIKQTFYNRPDTRSPIIAKFLNDIQDYMMQLGLIKDYVVDSDVTPTGTWIKFKSGAMWQTRRGTFASQTSTATRNLFGFYHVDCYLPDYPLPFLGTPVLLVDTSAGTTDHIRTNEYEQSSTGGGIVRLQVAQPNISITAVYNYLAIGRWK